MTGAYAIETPKGGACARCGETDFSPNVEAFETFGTLVCDDCVDAVFADDELTHEDD